MVEKGNWKLKQNSIFPHFFFLRGLSFLIPLTHDFERVTPEKQKLSRNHFNLVLG